MAAATGFTFRPATAADIDIVTAFSSNVALETEGKRLNAEVVRQGVTRLLTDASKGLCFVAELAPGGDGTPAAAGVVAQLFVTFEWSDWSCADVWWIQSVYVAPSHRGRGVFRQLYAHAKGAAKVSGAVGLRLYVDNANAGAQEVYRKLGMTTHNTVYEDMWGK